MKNYFPVFLLMILISSLNAQTLPNGFSKVLVAQGLSFPTVIDFAPDGRIFVGKQNGELKVIKNGTVLSKPAIDLEVDASAERGLVGITLHPDFATNQWIYLYYTVNKYPAHNRISRFTFTGDIINPSSEVIILDLDPLEISPIHNGGCMKFGQDGKLYVTIGENNQAIKAQNPDTYWGKMIRINPDGSVPSDNPFVLASTPQKKRLWAMGMRNPFSFDIQPGTGRIFINEVGHALWEEIQDATTPGLNFGWPAEQGNNPGSQFTNPFYAYGHGDGTQVGCAIAGGCFFNPAYTNYPSEYIGKYFFMDYCEGWIGYIDPERKNTSHTVFSGEIPATSVTLKVGLDGNLYFLGRDNGGVYKIVYNNSTIPIITEQPDDVTIARSQSVLFTVNASGTPPFTYVWKKDNITIPNSNASTYQIKNAQLSDNGMYSVSITNAFGNVSSRQARLTVASNLPPSASIITPATGLTYTAGDTIHFSGTGSDSEDGVLPVSSFVWQIEFHHGTGSNHHIHDGPPIVIGARNGSYVIPVNNETSHVVFYRLILVVKDKDGFTDTTFVDILPEKSVITLNTIPPDLRLTLDGMPRNTAYSESSVEGIERVIGMLTPQAINGVPYVFDRWSHGGALSQMISTPKDDVTYTAIFKEDTELRIPENPANALPGLQYDYYEGLFYVVPDYSTLKSNRSGIVSTFSIISPTRTDNFSFRYKGYIEVPTDGKYTFYSESNDGSKLYIGNRMIVNNDGEHNTKEVAGSIALKAGKHEIIVGYIETIGSQNLKVSYAGPGITKQTIPASKLFHINGSVNKIPLVSITDPINNQFFSSVPASVFIKANATDSDGSISKVEFFNNNIKIGEDLAFPYEYNWKNVTTGNYTLTARAWDNQMANFTSEEIRISLGASTSVTCPSSGAITREFWNNVRGAAVSFIPISTVPSGIGSVNLFEGPLNSSDNYGTRIRGYLCAPQTGSYYFWIASNDNGELWLSTDEDPLNKIKIASVGSFTAYREWTKLSTQKSAAIALEAGKKYYVEALHKEGTGTDHISIGWQLPDGTLERPITGTRLIPFEGNFNNAPSVFITSPGNEENYSAPASIIINANAEDSDGNIVKVEFYKGTIKLGEDISFPYSFTWNNVEPGSYEITAKAIDNQNASKSSDVVRLHVSSGACLATGTITREYWNGVSGTSVSNIPVHLTPTGINELLLLEGPENIGVNYGTRIRGYICPPNAGNYIFWISGNDNCELWLSTDDTEDNKIRIAFVNGSTGVRQWNKYGTQQSGIISLVTGKKYYVEVLHKQGVGTDHIAVGWQKPDGTLERPIPGLVLSSYKSAPDRVSEFVTLKPTWERESEEKIMSFNVYPNPTQMGIITLSIEGYEGTRHKVFVEVVRVSGEAVYSEKVSCETTCRRTIINVDEKFYPGVYIVSATIDGKKYSERLVIY